MNVLDWGTNNNLLVGLGCTVYIWNFATTQVKKLTQFDNFNIISAIQWNSDGEKAVVGTLTGLV